MTYHIQFTSINLFRVGKTWRNDIMVLLKDVYYELQCLLKEHFAYTRDKIP